MFEEIIPKLTRKGTREAGNEKHTFQQLQEESASVAFVDGGNAVIFESPAARVEFVRSYGVMYNGKERQETKKEEGFLLLQYQEGEKISITGQGLAFSMELDALDETLRLGKERVSLATAANLARFIIECQLLATFDAAVLLRDGPLLGNNAQETAALKRLDEKGLLGGLCKTNTLLGKGGSISANLLSKGPKEAWLSPVKEEEGIKISLVKLHEKSTYAFRLDANREVEKVAGALLPLSGDPVFPGYPYPLIEADRMARVSNQEAEQLTMRFRAEAGAEWQALEQMAHGSDAHSVLDRIG